jgi:DNA-directed RNA polymerase sigma subunit (sigma70/sigma32)
MAGISPLQDGEALDVRAMPTRDRTNTMAAIGDFLGITRERVRQLHNETILKVRSVVRGRDR